MWGSAPEVQGFNSIKQQRGLHPPNTEGTALFQGSISCTATEVYICRKAVMIHCAMLILLKIEAGISWHKTPQSKEKSSNIVDGWRKSRTIPTFSIVLLIVFKDFLELSFQLCAKRVRIKNHLISLSIGAISNREHVVVWLGKDPAVGQSLQ